MKTPTSPEAAIIKQTGKKPVECKCSACKSQCVGSGLALPSEIEAMINDGKAGHLNSDRGDVMIAGEKKSVYLLRIMREGDNCIEFDKDTGLCKIHKSGYKPLECRLSHHSYGVPRRNKEYISYAVASYWKASDYVRLYQLKIISDFISLTNMELFNRIVAKEVTKVRCGHCQEIVDANFTAMHEHLYGKCQHHLEHSQSNGHPDRPQFESLITL